MASDKIMASVLKRKRGPVEVVEPSKKVKSTRKNQNPTTIFDSFKVGWDAAFPAKKLDEFAATNGADGVSASRISESPDAEDYGGLLGKHRAAKYKRNHEAEATQPDISTWKISEPIGGRMIDVDPVFTDDEKFLIVAHKKNVQVYSTSNSLLHRSINLFVDESLIKAQNVAAYSLSPTDPNILWLACTDGTVYKVDWTSGEGGDRSWRTSDVGLSHMTVASMDSDGRKRDVIFTTEKQGGVWRISAHELSILGTSPIAQSRVIYTSPKPIHIIKSTDEGGIIIAASEERVLLGTLRSTDFGTVDKIKYEFRIFESTDFVSSMDIRISKRLAEQGRKVAKLDKISVVDVVVGDVRGAIFVHNDLLANLIRSQNPNAEVHDSINLIPRKLHWHRKAVHSVKWSLDGNYIISGGSETVLVLWQLDTGRQQYLPHLSAAIQNIVVSPRGTSYAIHLRDNSTMVLSASELTPIANIAGIQAHVVGNSISPNSRVRRVVHEDTGRPLIPRTPAVINPKFPNRLLLAVGEVQELSPNSAAVYSAPFLQTFDIASNYNLSRQALSRTNVTNKNMAPSAHSISEPLVSHMQISPNGEWLVTVDEWMPPKHDVEFLGHSGMDLQDERRRRREVYLKFWQWNKSEESWALVSRVDGPHAMAIEKNSSGRVLALAADPCSLTFSTLGEDGVVKIWRPKVRKRDGVIVSGQDGEPLCTWDYRRQISLGTAELEDDTGGSARRIPVHASLTFSEDGSVLAAAMSRSEGGFIHLIDPFLGTIQSSHSVMYRGDLISMALLGQYLIILSDDLRVYDLVLEELKYGIELGAVKWLLSLEQKAEMMHLVADRTSRTFVVALPSSDDNFVKDSKAVGSLSKAYTELAVFDPQNPTPLYSRELSSLVTAVVPAISSPGFVVLDGAAEITTVSPKTSQTLTSIARPIVELRLDIRSEEAPAMNVFEITEDAEDETDLDMEDEVGEAAQEISIDPEDDGPRVVTQQKLAEVLNIGPSFALPPVEEMFYRVADLISGKPILKSTS